MKAEAEDKMAKQELELLSRHRRAVEEFELTKKKAEDWRQELYSIISKIAR